MSKPAFMSPEHVDAMNGLLAASDEIAEACSDLDRAYTLHYHLTGAPGGTEAHWTMTFDSAGVRFGLDRPSSADLVVESDYGEMIRSTIETRAGKQPTKQPPMTGDLGVLEKIGPAFAVARSVATIDVEFPDV
jgi:hypothetical protein